MLDLLLRDRGVLEAFCDGSKHASLNRWRAIPELAGLLAYHRPDDREYKDYAIDSNVWLSLTTLYGTAVPSVPPLATKPVSAEVSARANS